MGNNQPEAEKFNELHWRRMNGEEAEVWLYENCNDKNVHIERHIVGAANEEEFQRIKEFSFLRKNNPRWVSALYFQYADSHSQFCSPRYEAKLYLQKIAAKLNQINNISFPDALHLYDQCLNGYEQFARIIGCFHVEGGFIGVNEAGVVKVWAGSGWNEVTVRGGTVAEEDMVKSIVNCLENAIDRNAMPSQYPTIGGFLYRNYKRINFDHAIKELRNYTRITNMGTIPARLNTPFFNEQPAQKKSQVFQPRQSQAAYVGVPMATTYNPPRFSFQRDQLERENAFRKVNSMSAFPTYQEPFPQFAATQPIRQVPIFERTLSNPQLISGSRVNHFSSTFQQLATVPIETQRIPIKSQHLAYTQPLANYPNPPISFQQPSLQGSKVAFKASPIPVSQSNKNINQQSKPFSIVRQSELVIYPPSQTQIPSNSNPIPNTDSSILRVQSSYKKSAVQTPILSKESTDDYQKKNAEQSQSIIMQLQKSQASLNAGPAESKYVSYLKSNDYLEPTKKYDYYGTTTEIQSIKSSPSGNFDTKYLTPTGMNKKELSNLNSIEEVQTEHYWKENSSKNSSVRQAQQASSPYSLNNIKETYNFQSKPSKQLVFNNSKPKVIDENDGKSSDDFLKKLKEMSSVGFDFKFESSKVSEYSSTKNFDFTGNNYDYSSKNEYNYTFDRKKSPEFTETYDFESRAKTNEYSYGETETNKYQTYGTYEASPSISTTNIAQKYNSGSAYKGGIDPELWADLQKSKE